MEEDFSYLKTNRMHKIEYGVKFLLKKIYVYAYMVSIYILKEIRRIIRLVKN